MKNFEYITPEIEIIKFSEEDILTGSSFTLDKEGIFDKEADGSYFD